MDGFNHAASVSNVRQVVTPQRVSIFGHYAVLAPPCSHTACQPPETSKSRHYHSL